MNDVEFYLLLDRIEVQSANAISSPITYGFPALSGFLGAIHALNRQLPPDLDFALDGVLVACHECNVKRYRQHDFADYSLNQSRNPIKKNGKTASIIEEGKVDIIVSLVVEIRCGLDGYDFVSDNRVDLEEKIQRLVFQQRIAGGSVHGIGKVSIVSSSAEDDLKVALLPAFVLVDASQDLVDITAALQRENTEATEIDALIEVATLRHTPEENTSGETTGWATNSVKTGRGWLVPIPVGFQSIATAFPPGVLANSRSNNYTSEYVESLYGLGKWVFPHSIGRLSDSFWRYDNSGDGVFLINQTND